MLKQIEERSRYAKETSEDKCRVEVGLVSQHQWIFIFLSESFRAASSFQTDPVRLLQGCLEHWLL